MCVLAIMLCVVVAQGARSLSPAALRIYGGVDDTHGEFPYIVSLMPSSGVRGCSGSLITDRWVLTAGHCASNSGTGYVRYVNFEQIYNETKTYTRIVRQIAYPQTTIYLNDIGLAKTEMAIHRPVVALSALDYRSLIGYSVKYAGFGVQNRKPFFSYDIQMKEQDRKTNYKVGEGVVVKCPPKEKPFIFMQRLVGPEICAARKCGIKQICRPGDSGGPLVYDGKIVGVLAACVPPIQLQQWTPISPFTEWIRDTIAKTTN